MDLLHTYKWLWVIIAIIFASGVISLIFIFINKCISRQGKHRITQLHRSSNLTVMSNNYQERTLKDFTPALPPRTQFLTEAQSYENLAEDYEECTPEYEQDKGDCEQSTPDYEQDKGDYVQGIPDYEQDKGDYEQSMPDYEQDKGHYEQSFPDYEQDKGDYVQDIPDYEQDKGDYEQSFPDYEQDKGDYKQSMPDYVQDMDEQSDYVEPEDGEVLLPPPPPLFKDPDPAAGYSSEDYDDIGDEDENQGEEDYDDVG
ncbi:hypothetical protein ABVT39_006239 [Epinephelus coioides]